MRQVSKRLGLKKGNISLALEEAIKDWIKKTPELEMLKSIAVDPKRQIIERKKAQQMMFEYGEKAISYFDIIFGNSNVSSEERLSAADYANKIKHNMDVERLQKYVDREYPKFKARQKKMSKKS